MVTIGSFSPGGPVNQGRTPQQVAFRATGRATANSSAIRDLAPIFFFENFTKEKLLTEAEALLDARSRTYADPLYGAAGNRWGKPEEKIASI